MRVNTSLKSKNYMSAFPGYQVNFWPMRAACSSLCSSRLVPEKNNHCSISKPTFSHGVILKPKKGNYFLTPPHHRQHNFCLSTFVKKNYCAFLYWQHLAWQEPWLAITNIAGRFPENSRDRRLWRYMNWNNYRNKIDRSTSSPLIDH